MIQLDPITLMTTNDYFHNKISKCIEIHCIVRYFIFVVHTISIICNVNANVLQNYKLSGLTQSFYENWVSVSDQTCIDLFVLKNFVVNDWVKTSSIF